MKMKIEEKYMNICIQIAKQGIGKVSPNPMVGCVITYEGEIIGEGYHEEYGKAHAEVNAINSVKDKNLLKNSTLYVNLEPCSHFGKTPPCADLIIEHQIPKVVIGCIDSFSQVSGKGIQKLEESGIEVIVGVLKSKSLELNKRFFTYHNKKRPYIILKWAKTQDGFIDVDRYCSLNGIEVEQFIDNWITTPESKKIVHHWRAEVQAIMIGTNTALNDNPQLTVREVQGNNPLRVILDLNLRLPSNLCVFDGSVSTVVFNYNKDEKRNNLEYIKLKKEENLLAQILKILHQREIQSILIEGGGKLLNTFIKENLWDEARVFTGIKEFKTGLIAPKLDKTPSTSLLFGEDHLDFYTND